MASGLAAVARSAFPLKPRFRITQSFTPLRTAVKLLELSEVPPVGRACLAIGLRYAKIVLYVHDSRNALGDVFGAALVRDCRRGR